LRTLLSMNLPPPPLPPGANAPAPKSSGHKVVWIVCGVVAAVVFGSVVAIGAGAYWFFKAATQRVGPLPTPVQVGREARAFTPPPMPPRTAAFTPAQRAPFTQPAQPLPAPKPPASVVATPLYQNGAFGFPQREAMVLCDRADLRLSVWSNSGFLFAQAVLWTDGDPALGRLPDGREIGDNSVLSLTLGNGPSRTPDVDRDYMLNPWPTSAGLRYIVWKNGGSTGILSDTAGLGAIRYEQLPAGQRVRVDTYLIPLDEIAKRSGDRIALAFWARSPQPDLWLNSTSSPSRQGAYSFHIPRENFHVVTLQAGHAIDLNRVPAEAKPAQRSAPVGSVARGAGTAVSSGPADGALLEMKFTALDGRQVDLAAMRGKVVLIDFWATWCGPCVAELPHVLEAYAKLHDRGFEIVGISFDSDRAKLESMVRANGMAWPQFFDGKGWQNQFGQQHGIRAIPTMWLVDKRGRLVSKNARANLAAQVEKLLAE